MDTRADLWIEGGKIRHCSPQQAEIGRETEVINADNLTVMPGLFDMHVHLREPGHEHKETIRTGTLAAANGGFTGVVCMPNTEPAIDSRMTVEYIQRRASNGAVDAHCCAAITKARAGKELAPLLDLMESGAVMYSDDGGCVESAEMMRRAFDYVAEFDLLLTQHCEEHSLTRNFAVNEGEMSAKMGLKGYPAVAEDIIVARDILLADYCGNRRYHGAHISTAGAVRLFREAKNRGQRVSCEVAPHHFILDESTVQGFNVNAKMNPPLRTRRDIEAILQGLADGSIDCIATDHAPHALHEKNVEFSLAANGIIGLETSLGLSLTYLYHTGVASLSRIVELMSVNPRRVLNLPQPLIASGEPANLTFVDVNKEWVVSPELFCTKSLNTPFDGYILKGLPVMTINRGIVTECKLT
ncbi:dihydroorotase [Ignavibacteria bacterium]|nr:dihydroorotase [Bacteroidota bacterium]